MPDISRRGAGEKDSAHRPQTRSTLLGEFLGSARWLAMPRTAVAHVETIAAERLARDTNENFAAEADAQGGDAATEDAELGPLLGAIADEVHQTAAAARAGINAECAARAAFARRHLPRHALAGILAAIKQARMAALAAVKRNAAVELAGRKKAAIAARRRRPATRRATTRSHRRPR